MTTPRAPWLMLLPLILGCAGNDPLEAATARCRRADAARERVPELKAQGRLDQAVRVLERAGQMCLGKADRDLEELIRLHAELGDADAVRALADRVTLSPTATPGARAVVSEALAQVSRGPAPSADAKESSRARLADLRDAYGRAVYEEDSAAEQDAMFGFVSTWESGGDPASLAAAARAAFHADDRVTAQRFFDRALHAARKTPLHIDFPGRDADAGRIVVALGNGGRFLATVHQARPDARTVRIEELGAAGVASRAVDNEVPVASLLFSNAERLLAAMGSDGSVRIYDAATGALQRTLMRAAGADGLVVFSADDRTLATAGEWGQEGTVQLWSVETGEMLRELEGGPLQVWQLAFSPDGKILSGVGMASLRWEVETGKKLASAERETDPSGGLALSPDGSVAAHAPAQHELVLVDMATGKELNKPLTIPDGDCDDHFSGPMFLPGGVLRVQSGPRFRYLDQKTGAELPSAGPREAPAADLVSSPDGRFAAAPVDGGLRLFDTRSAQPGPPIDLGDLPADSALLFSGDGSRLASASPDGTVQAWDTATHTLLRRRRFSVERWSDAAAIHSAAVAPDGSLAFSTRGRGISVWSRKAGTFLPPVALNEADLTFSPDGSLLVARGQEDGWIVVIDAATAKVVTELPHRAHDEILAISPDARSFASVDAEGEVRLAKVSEPGTSESLGHACRLPPTFSPDGRVLALAREGSLNLWDVAGKRLLHQLRVGSACTERPAFDQPVFDRLGQVLAWSRDPRQIGVWEVATGRRLAGLTLAEGTAGAKLAFGPNGLLATSDGACHARLWNTRGGRLVRELTPGSGACEVTFSPDGQVLAGMNQGALVLFPRLEEPPVVLQGEDEPLRGVLALPRAGSWLTIDASGTARVWSQSDPRPLVTLRFAEEDDEIYALAPEHDATRVEVFGDEPGIHARCRLGEEEVPFELCRDRVESKGLWARALEGERVVEGP